jgi:excisionase family DNA binding protein
MWSLVVSVIEPLPPTISVERAGELLGVSRRAAYRAASRGQIPTLRVGRRLLVPTQRLLTLLGMTDTDDKAPPVSPRFVIEDIRPEEPTTPAVKAVRRRDRSQVDLAPRPTLAQE